MIPLTTNISMTSSLCEYTIGKYTTILYSRYDSSRLCGTIQYVSCTVGIVVDYAVLFSMYHVLLV